MTGLRFERKPSGLKVNALNSSTTVPLGPPESLGKNVIKNIHAPSGWVEEQLDKVACEDPFNLEIL